MMRKILLFIIGLSVLYARPSLSEINIAYYIDFSIEAYVPYPEDVNWEEDACKYEIHKEDFLSALSEIDDESVYYAYVIAKAVLSGAGVYFIDRNINGKKGDGIVRHENNVFYSIDKSNFEKMLYPILCPIDKYENPAQAKRRFQAAQRQARQWSKERELLKHSSSSKGTKKEKPITQGSF
ncbi:MAG: hypothetical protein LBF61_07670 [Azoarcus sp.]|jgi:hypothetical protein|nr:hypothetical protein [Azoarcus sp.]